MKTICSFLAMAALELIVSPGWAQLAPPPGAAPVPAPLPAAAPTVTQPVPPAPVAATPAAPAAQDSWSQAIDKSRTQEAVVYEDVRTRQEDLAEAAAFEAGPAKLRQRLRFFVGLGGGFQSYHRFSDAYVAPFSSTSYIEGVQFNAEGPIFHVAGGLRGTVARHFDLQARLSLSVAKMHGSMDIDTGSKAPSSSSSTNYGNFDVDSSGTFWGAELDGTVRWLPQLFGPRFFVGLGPLLELTSVNASPTEAQPGLPPFSVSELGITAYGLLELGVIFGAQEEWEVALRGGAGVGANHDAKDAEVGQLSVARAF